MLKCVDTEFLTNYRPGSSHFVSEKYDPFLRVLPIAHGRHVCHDKEFVENFKREFDIAKECPPQAVTHS